MNASRDPGRCPLCGGGNACVLVEGGESCWCVDVRIAPETLARLPPEAKNVVCICRRCAQPPAADAERRGDPPGR